MAHRFLLPTLLLTLCTLDANAAQNVEKERNQLFNTYNACSLVKSQELLKTLVKPISVLKIETKETSQLFSDIASERAKCYKEAQKEAEKFLKKVQTPEASKISETLQNIADKNLPHLLSEKQEIQNQLLTSMQEDIKFAIATEDANNQQKKEDDSQNVEHYVVESEKTKSLFKVDMLLTQEIARRYLAIDEISSTVANSTPLWETHYTNYALHHLNNALIAIEIDHNQIPSKTTMDMIYNNLQSASHKLQSASAINPAIATHITSINNVLLILNQSELSADFMNTLHTTISNIAQQIEQSN